jgi:hypothetical protein
MLRNLIGEEAKANEPRIDPKANFSHKVPTPSRPDQKKRLKVKGKCREIPKQTVEANFRKEVRETASKRSGRMRRLLGIPALFILGIFHL